VAIIKHPDVRRMLMTMRSRAEATRALAYVVAAAHDTALRHPDVAERKRQQAFVDLMIPVVKGWSTESGVSIASIGADLAGREGGHLAAIRSRFRAGIDALAVAGEWLVTTYGVDVRAASAGAVPFLMLLGIVAGGWQMARAGCGPVYGGRSRLAPASPGDWRESSATRSRNFHDQSTHTRPDHADSYPLG